jgi:hypothetical protein
MKKLTIALLAASIFMFAVSAFAVTKTFSDVSTSDWFHDDVMNMVDWGVIEGYPDGTFGPANNVNRAELSAMWNRYDNRVMSANGGFAILGTADDGIIAGNIVINNMYARTTNHYHGTSMPASCELITVLKDLGVTEYDAVAEMLPDEDIATPKAEYIANMDEMVEVCQSVWSQEFLDEL